MLGTLIIYSFLGLTVFVWSPLGKALAEKVRADAQAPPQSPQLQTKVLELEQRLRENERELETLRESVLFFESLLPAAEAKEKIKELREKSKDSDENPPEEPSTEA